MAIGVFDSGVGGLSIHRELVARFAGQDFVYLSDQARMPYGVRPGPEIVAFTREGCERLFAEGCDLVILACNTASSIALRRLQQDWLPKERQRLGRTVNVLGIIVPTIEAATGKAWTAAADPPPQAGRGPKLEAIGVFCTPGTAASRVYEIEIDKRRHDLDVIAEPCPDLAHLIEAGTPHDALRPVVQGHVRALVQRIGGHPARAILGCTHYEIVADLFREALPPAITLIHQPPATAEALDRYLTAHPHYVGGAGRRRFLTSGAAGDQSALVAAFWGSSLRFEAA